MIYYRFKTRKQAREFADKKGVQRPRSKDRRGTWKVGVSIY